MVPIIPLIIFSTNKLEVELTNGEFTVSLEDGWIIFIVTNHIVSNSYLFNLNQVMVKVYRYFKLFLVMSINNSYLFHLQKSS